MHKWKTEWIEIAEDLVRDEYARRYEGKEECVEDDAEKSDEDIVSCGAFATPTTNNLNDLSWPLMLSSATLETTPST